MSTASQFPDALDALLRITDGFKEVEAIDLNDLQNAIQAVQTAYGTDPAGSKTDLATRLAVNLDADGALKECYWGVTQDADGNFSVPPVTGSPFSSDPHAFAMSMGDPGNAAPVIWCCETNAVGATFYGAKRGGGTPNEECDVAWIVWNPNP